MTMYWIYGLPNWQLALLMVATSIALAELGFFATRPLTRRLLGDPGQNNDVVSYFLAGIGMLYGLALGLIAVATWQDYTDVDALISKESASLAGLYRDLDGYPAPMRAELEGAVRAYTRSIVEVDWPAHRRGEVKPEGVLALDAIENQVLKFEPGRESQKVIHAEVVRGLNSATELRTLREGAVGAGLPGALWGVVLAGAVVNVALNYLFRVENVTLHALLIAALAGFLALLLFLTAAMDNPFRGEFSVSPDAYQYVLDHDMSPPA